MLTWHVRDRLGQLSPGLLSLGSGFLKVPEPRQPLCPLQNTYYSLTKLTKYTLRMGRLSYTSPEDSSALRKVSLRKVSLVSAHAAPALLQRGDAHLGLLRTVERTLENPQSSRQMKHLEVKTVARAKRAIISSSMPQKIVIS